MVLHAFQNCIIPEGINHTIITLIPKVEGPQNMSQFRPISLCKVISKVIVAKIRPIMQHMICHNQVSYVPGRNISDNIMIAQEILLNSENRFGKRVLCLEIDLSKAYDRLSWSFIKMVL